jgi:hypothetical protein
MNRRCEPWSSSVAEEMAAGAPAPAPSSRVTPTSQAFWKSVILRPGGGDGGGLSLGLKRPASKAKGRRRRTGAAGGAPGLGLDECEQLERKELGDEVGVVHGVVQLHGVERRRQGQGGGEGSEKDAAALGQRVSRLQLYSHS